jgi:hypothetical protein
MGGQSQNQRQCLKDLQSRALKIERDLHFIPLSWPYRDLTCKALILLRQAQHIAIIKDMAIKKEAIWGWISIFKGSFRIPGN